MDIQKVKVDLQCPICGHCAIVRVGSHRKVMKCPECRQFVFLSWATGVAGELDDNGCYFKAYDVFGYSNLSEACKDLFDTERMYG